MIVAADDDGVKGSVSDIAVFAGILPFAACVYERLVLVICTEFLLQFLTESSNDKRDDRLIRLTQKAYSCSPEPHRSL